MEKPDPDGDGYVLDYSPPMVKFEHKHIPRSRLPARVREHFPKGACKMFRDDVLVAVIPASKSDVRQLEEMLRSGKDMEWIARCRELCAPSTPAEILDLLKNKLHYDKQ